MNEIAVFQLLHTIGFAYWLGVDLGVFYTSYFVANPKLSPEARATAARILFALDQGPRICMTLVLPLGIHLAWLYGIFGFDAIVMAVIWTVCIAWLAMVITLHLANPSPRKTLLTRFDFIFRIAIAILLIAVGAFALTSSQLRLPHWISWKLAIYGGLIACGLVIRLKLKHFGPAMTRIIRGEADTTDNTTIASSLGSTRPYVILIWIGLIVSTALGLRLF
ncbi:MAG: hypothetical protein QNJ11_10980 [Woeseiaceae bacterium]|nr:hypothetical protein [Woeseiaceae bacterium]